jgi:hypothetical protein
MINMKIWKFTLICIGFGMLIANNISLLVTFIWAYFNDYEAVVVHINRYNEANIEMMLIPFTIILGCYAIYETLKYLPVKRRKAA